MSDLIPKHGGYRKTRLKKSLRIWFGLRMFVSKGSCHMGVLHSMLVGMTRMSPEVCIVSGIYTVDVLDSSLENGEVSKEVLKRG